MYRKKRNRLIGISAVFFACCLGVYLVLSSLNDNIVFFYTPSDLYKIKSSNQKVRVGGIVKKDSIVRFSSNKISFVIADNKSELKIEFQGILPALFREKQGIVAEGTLENDQLFKASSLLAKHDENYRPPETSEVNLFLNPISDD